MAGLVGTLAELIGARPDALLLLLTLLSGYPLGFIYRQFLYGKTAWKQHIYFIACGFTLGYLNFGLDVLHSAINILIIYVIIRTCGGTKLSILLAFTINMTYLSVGYYSVMTTVYTVTWTTPQCVLTLRLIGLIFDIYDGNKKPDQLSEEQKRTALTKIPTLLEVAGHTYFYGSFLVGPQFPMRRYQDFITGAFSDPVTGGLPASVTPALIRLAAGLFYTLAFQIGAMYFPDSYLLSSDFENANLVVKCFIILIWGKITLYKYVACWLITEGTCILTGLTYNGKDENGNNLWDSCANIKIRNYESAMGCQQIIAAFNINTNRWMAKYIFKRLKFLGNKDVSQGTTLFFLAIWHGLYSGYFMNFFLEFPIIKFERDLARLLLSIPVVAAASRSRLATPILWLMCRTYSQFALSYALVSFNFLTYNMWGWVYWQVYYIGHVVFCGWLFVYPLYRMATRPVKHRTHQNGTSDRNGALNEWYHMEGPRKPVEVKKRTVI